MDYRTAFQILKNGGYATYHNYVDNLCRVVEKWSLTRFDGQENSGVIWCVSIADTFDKSVARSVAVVYPGCKVHHVKVLDAGGMEMWIASVADVGTRDEAVVAQRQYASARITGIIHKVKILE